MNKRITILMVALVSTILPAVAVADVMLTGNANIQGSQNTPVFYLGPGPNYQTADGSILWNSYTNGSYMGLMHFMSISNQTTFIINVMKITFKDGIPSGTFYLNVTTTGAGLTPFQVQTYMYVSLDKQVFSNFTYSGLPGATPTPNVPGIAIYNLSQSSPATQSYSFTVDGSSVLYIGYFTAAYNGLSSELSGEVLSTMTYTTQ